MSESDAGEGRITSTVTHLDDVSVIALVGELDLSNAGALRAHLEESVSGHTAPVVLDLTGVTFMDSTALGVLVRIRKLLRAEGRAFRVVCPAGPVLRLFTITGLVGTFGVHDDLAAVRESLAGESGG